MRGRSPALTERLASSSSESALCSVVVHELFFGAARSANPRVEFERVKRFISVFPSLSVDDAAAQRGAEIRANLAANGTPIGPYDLLIAAIASVHALVLVTGNVAEFERVPGMKCEDWSGSQRTA